MDLMILMGPFKTGLCCLGLKGTKSQKTTNLSSNDTNERISHELRHEANVSKTHLKLWKCLAPEL